MLKTYVGMVDVKEFVGLCSTCQVAIYCFEGFLNGIYKDGQLICFHCDSKKEEEKAN